MVDLETVLVLGAGASTDYGFPTGRGLVEKVCSQSDHLHIDLGQLNSILGGQNRDTVKRFSRALSQADPPSVDVWLEDNPEFLWVGKVAIAAVLLAHEQHSNLRPDNNWYRLLFDRLQSPYDDFQKNRLAIVTFNYDRSLEQYFFGRFTNTHTTKSQEECKEKLSQLDILHVYGSLGRLPWQNEAHESPMPQVPYGAERAASTVISAAKGIETMADASSGVSARLQKFQDLMKDCKALYFLGFGYHDMNMQRLGVETLRRPGKVMGTALGLGYQRIREIERLSIRGLRSQEGLFQHSIYDFLHKCVDFNEGGYPATWVYQE